MPPGGQRTIGRHVVILLSAACTGCIPVIPRRCDHFQLFASALPARGASGGRPAVLRRQGDFASALPARGASGGLGTVALEAIFASALPARGASANLRGAALGRALCLGAACTGCIYSWAQSGFFEILCLGAACTGCIEFWRYCKLAGGSLPRRCLHGVHP